MSGVTARCAATSAWAKAVMKGFPLPQHGYRHTGDLLLHQLTNMLTDGRFNAASLAIGLTVAASTGPALPKIQLIATQVLTSSI